jgi:LPS sulfotransferase NodH
MEPTSTDREPCAPQLAPLGGRKSVWMDPRLDFTCVVPLLKSYIVASSYRCGSTFFCWKLWGTGVLGAPCEYLNVGAGRMLRDALMRRLGADTPERYFTELLACRTSKNGVFGMKAHFPHFEAALRWHPAILRVLSPVNYIYIDRKDMLAQAISMAKASQTDAWSEPGEEELTTTPVYNGPQIVQCLRELHQQKLGWLRWFAANEITPFVVRYEDAVADPSSAIRRIVELLGVADDEPEQIALPVLEKRDDAVNREWRDRFQRAAPDWESWFLLPDL